MRIKALLFAAVLSAVSSNVFAFEHLVKENVSTTFTLRDGDKVVFLDNNSAWGMANRLVFGISLVSGQVLSGSLVVNDCAYSLEGYYKEVDFAYEKGVVVKYHGPEQLVRIQGWKDSAPAVAKCEDVGSASVVVRDDEKKTQEELDWLAKKAEQQLQYAVKTAQYRDLGPLETVTLFEGPSGLFKVTKLPEWDFNRIYVQVEPMDGRELNGGLYSNEVSQKLSGWSISIPVNRMTDMPFDFELAFPEYRKVKLKWWATMEAAKEEPIQMSEKSLGGDSVEATYTYGHAAYDNHSVKLKFRKSAFVNGSIPVVKSFDTNPDGVMRIDSLKSYGALGAVYDVHAEFKGNDTITFALPLEYSYNPNDDSVYVLHQVDGKWVNVPVDSVKDGFAYFRTNSFSFIVTILTSIAPVVACALWDPCRETSQYFFDKSAKFVNWLRNFGADVVCVDIDGFKELFGEDDDDDDEEWADALVQGTLKFNDVASSPDGNPEILLAGVPDFGAQDIFDVLKRKKNENLIKVKEGKTYTQNDGKTVCDDKDNDEVCEWKVTKRNFDILLADAILAQRKDEGRRFVGEFYDKDLNRQFLKTDVEEYDYLEYFKINSGFVELADWYVKGIEACVGGINYTGKVATKWVDFYKSVKKHKNYTSMCRDFMDAIDFPGTGLEQSEDIVDCGTFLGEASDNALDGNLYNIFEQHQENLQIVADVMIRISLLAWIDKSGFRNFLRLNYQQAYDGVHDWLDLAGPFLQHNNIVAKAYASLSLFEYLTTGGSENLESLNDALELHYSSNGAYSEGTGYSQYIWDDVPYVLSALQDAYATKGKKLNIEENFLKSPDYMFRFSRPVGNPGNFYGLIPVEIDDGCTYNPDYRVWAKLKDAPKYLAISERFPLRDADGKKNVLVPFGFPDKSLYNSTKKIVPERKAPWGRNQDGLMIITAERKDGEGNILDTVALSMVAEGGDMWKRGQAHDQQDNLSMTLTSSKNGFIIQDRGYPKFDDRKPDDNFHRYGSHNVVVPDDASQADNRQIPYDEMYERLQDFTNEVPGIAQRLIMYFGLDGHIDFWMHDHYNFSVEGGEEAVVDGDDKNIYDVDNGIIGYTADLNFGSGHNVETRVSRSILYFGGSFWVIDRPVITDDALEFYYPQSTWLANSPIETWRDLTEAKLKLYGSGLDPLGEDEEDAVEGVKVAVRQNGNRADYTYDEDLGGIALSNYSYSFKDESAKTYVMTYAVNDEGFVKTDERCSKDFQCFENAAKDKRLIVAPYGKPFGHCKFLPKDECSYDQDLSFDGIMLAVKEGDGWYVLPLGGQITERNDDDLGEGVIDLPDRPVSALLTSRNGNLLYMYDGNNAYKRYKSTYLPANAILLR